MSGGGSAARCWVRKVKFQGVWGAGEACREAGGCHHTGRGWSGQRLMSVFCWSDSVWVGQELTLNISQMTGNPNKSKSTSLFLLRRGRGELESSGNRLNTFVTFVLLNVH